ncbi:ADP-heptose--LPS heptosyltransferase, partial [Salmonella enterica subsp. enterica serovar Anatum]|nr:ADP-heptose--LPS heptosyltransferase [Salmonella enterica subsp. enterica serovar Anatum]
YDKGVMRTAKDLPQPLLWPQLQVSEGEKSLMCSDFSLSSERPWKFIINISHNKIFSAIIVWKNHFHFSSFNFSTIENFKLVIVF